MRAWRALLCLGVFVPISLWLTIAFTPLCASISPALIRRDALARADALYVLTSNVRGGDLNLASMSRLAHGLTLVREGWAPRLVISELPKRKRYAEAATRFVRQRGLAREVVVLGRATNTRKEAVEVAKAARERGWQRVILVTSPLHTRRAAATFERAGLEVLSSPAAEVEFDERLQTPADRFGAFGKIVYESLALLAYRLRGWV